MWVINPPNKNYCKSEVILFNIKVTIQKIIKLIFGSSCT